MTQAPGARALRRAEVSAALVAAGRRELARVGAAGLSLRAVAREMGMAPSALFRYVANRDDLLTLLIVDAYDDLGDHVEAVEAAVPRADRRGRWRAICESFREWAHAHPHEYALLYGSPVPEYHAPPERTGRAGTRVTDLLIALGAEHAQQARPAPIPGLPNQEAMSTLARVADVPDLDGEAFIRGLLAWTLLVGTVSSEVFEQAGSEIARLDTLFQGCMAVGELLLLSES